MAALALRLFPKASDEAVAEVKTLLASVSVIVLDKYVPGDWF